MPEVKWTKSSYSEASGNNCVEIAELGPTILIRDSKHPHHPRTTVSRTTWTAFTRTL
ncbi:DUF397 domain-containing protein [Streptomyces sp. ISL-12]|uniref:DUF397 domain-containing protein n=1 Tax=Streptomyces sp. ISL-12 TaxID=2819177 RepID=UPI001BE90B92|nr:DUF397 domain-containing protein [Streptomyces sp. ISL-12]MBT2409569.1 DUF397 domain-containing protein [Streptomyces sp. ISL-12]